MNRDVGMTLEECLVEYNGLIWKVVNKVSYKEKEELFQEACIEFMRSYRCYKRGKGAKFSTYVYINMYGVLRTYVRKQVGVVRYPEKIHNIWYVSFKHSLGVEHTEDISKLSGYSREEVEEAMRLLGNIQHASLDKNPSDDSEEGYNSIVNCFKVYDCYPSEETLDIRERLLDIEWFVLTKMAEGYTHAEIGKAVGVSRARIQKRAENIRGKLKEYVK